MRLARFVVFAVGALVASSCTCRPDLHSVDPGFRVSGLTQSLDFGRVLENTEALKPITLTADTNAAVTVTMTVASPFFVAATVDLEGGGQVDVPVTFHAGNGPASAEVVLTANGHELRVAVTGVGVRPKGCTASGPCVTSAYSLEQDTCIESPKPDDAACEPTSACLEQGRCRSGECLGTPRTCDDRNPCTVDACDLKAGCINLENLEQVCPRASNPCKAPACDVKTGCFEIDVPDLTPCGALNCVSSRVCVLGQCRTVPTPDGVECGPAIACLGPAHCHHQTCERPDAGPWYPQFTAALPGSPVSDHPSLLEGASGVYFEVCDWPVAVDGGGADAGPADLVNCALTSYTRNGFLRFGEPFDGGAPRRLAHVSPSGLIALASGGIEWRSLDTGHLVNFLPTPMALPSTRAVASQFDGTVLVAMPEADGGAHIIAWSDAGTRVRSEPGIAVKIIAITETNGLLGYDPNTGTVVLPGEGGVVVLPDGGTANSLVTAGGVTVAGLSHVLRMGDDGGVELVTLQWLSDAGVPVTPNERTVLLGQGIGIVMYRRCVDALTSCLDQDQAMFLRRFDAATGAFRSETQLLPAGLGETYEETALLGGVTGGVATFVHGPFAAAPSHAMLEILYEGQAPVFCPLPSPVVSVRGALFTGGMLMVLDDQGPGRAVLQGYKLNELPILGSGWPQADGLGGTRQARP